MTILESRAWRWPDLEACASSAAELASHAALQNACIELHGPLGAGKTTFVRYLLRTLGVSGSIKSPTYALMEPYEAVLKGVTFPISHFDFYRFDDPQEWDDAGFRDIFASPGLKLVEWPEKAVGFLPVPDLRLTIDAQVDERRFVRVEAETDVGRRLLQ